MPVCAKCSREQMLSWHIEQNKWRLLARKWWDKVLCLECYVELVSKRQNHLTILSPKDFSEIVICAKRVRGHLTDKRWQWKKSIKNGKKVWIYENKVNN